ncbi:hypothetical protein BKA82DRAFT_17755 [Pisolithus tinctorius]|uniref:Uncharacterized protein n=1 Tax=Pisolithus tinctorius Marx 270 TaxID=870435 RepID=A0A0C3K0J3_PISTI|nr:hypothetical protein BKA82DRAFT_17755 [Pisolithus tinctorius]KIO14903.1 hypothetical protein M404DRAFT_17755 [Pisolithus tinctorius Marx 270]
MHAESAGETMENIVALEEHALEAGDKPKSPATLSPFAADQVVVKGKSDFASTMNGDLWHQTVDAVLSAVFRGLLKESPSLSRTHSSSD